MGVDPAPGQRDPRERPEPEQHERHRDPQLRQSRRPDDHRRQEGEPRERRRVDQCRQRQGPDHPRSAQHAQLGSQRRRRSRPLSAARTPRHPHLDPDRRGQAEQRDRPEGGPPAEHRAHQGAGGYAEHRGERRTGEEEGERPPPPLGGDERGRRGQGDGEEARVRERRHHPRGQQEWQLGDERARHVRGGEHQHEPEQAAPRRPAPGQRGGQRCADDHADREGRRRQADGGRRLVEVRGEIGQQTGEDELGRTHGEHRQGKEVQRKRHRDSTGACAHLCARRTGRVSSLASARPGDRTAPHRRPTHAASRSGQVGSGRVLSRSGTYAGERTPRLWMPRGSPCPPP